MKRRIQEQWRYQLNEHKKSGLKATKFCKEHAFVPTFFQNVKQNNHLAANQYPILYRSHSAQLSRHGS